MNINLIKKELNSLINLKLKIKLYLGRNKYEYYEGYIKKMYPNIFVVNTNKGEKTFSYSDIASKQVMISKFD